MKARLIERTAATGQRPARDELVADFVREASSVFCDKNPKGSLTRAQRLTQAASLSQKEIFACLVKAYKVAQETRNVHPKHRHPEGDNRMPLFCKMLERFLAHCASGAITFDDERLAADVASDDRLVLFLMEQQLEGMLLGEESPGPAEEPIVLTEVPVEEHEPQAEATDQDLAPEGERKPQDRHGGQEPEEPGQLSHQPVKARCWRRFVEAEDPALGWRTHESADWWGCRLRDHLGGDRYDFACLPTRHGRYVIVLHERGGEIENGWLFGTSQQVREYL